MRFLRDELEHLRRHWLSCLLSCLIVHVAMEAVELVFEEAAEALKAEVR